MKYNLLWILIATVLSSCSDFLEESSQDEVRPSTVDDLMQIMVGEAFPMDFLVYAYDDFLTDDVECFGSSGDETLESSIEDKYTLFTWDDDMYEDCSGAMYNTWQQCYSKIMGCNTVMDYMDRVTGDEKTKRNMRGQTLVLRAYYYFLLVNYYAWPYNYGDPEKNLGVPLKLEMEVNDGYMARNTVAEVYDQIITDLKEGIRLLEENEIKMSLYKISDLTGKAILSRVYLYMEDWDNALTYANMVLQKKSTLTSLASAPEAAIVYQSTSNSWGLYNETVSNEIIWMYGGYRAYACYPIGGSYSKAPFAVSYDLLNIYDFNPDDKTNYGDLRRLMYYNYGAYIITTPYFHASTYANYAFKGGKSKKWASHGIRTAEIYLNRAEVYIRKFMKTGEDNYRVLALEDLNKLRENRYDTRNAAYSKVDISEADELLQFYKDERRRELCFEGHRWFDLRRYGMPMLTHKYFVNEESSQEVSLLEKDPRYVLPIPRNVLERNPYLKQNER